MYSTLSKWSCKADQVLFLPCNICISHNQAIKEIMDEVEMKKTEDSHEIQQKKSSMIVHLLDAR